jgi:hypothetical protein
MLAPASIIKRGQIVRALGADALPPIVLRIK